MILQRLAEHYDRITSSGDAQIALPGFSQQKISFCVVLEPDGRLNSFQSLQEQVGKIMRPRMMTVPGQSKPPGQGINPCFLWDNAAYMLGYKTDDENPERTAASFEAFRKRHCDLENAVNHSAFSAVCAFLRSWSPEQARQHGTLLREIASSFGVFRLAGDTKYVHEIVPAREEPDGDDDVEATAAFQGVCLVSGVECEIARLHEPKIKGVLGAQSSGALLVSFNASAYESYGRTQSYNAPVGSEIAFKYANALNYLLARRDRRISLGDATVVFWADHQTALEDCLSELFADAPAVTDMEVSEDKERLRQTRQFLTQLRDGAAEDSAIDEESQIKFFILGLSPNASRLSVRLWVEADVAELKKRLGQHLRDIQLDGRDNSSLTLWRIAAATGRAEFDPKGKLKKFDTDSVSPKLAGDLARSVLTGAAYPQSLLSAMLRRIRCDGEVHYARVAAIKASLIRNSRLRGNPIEASMKLDTSNSDAAYCCGRLFALLEKIQTDSADGELNTTIKDRYFSSASTTPEFVFPRLFRLSQHHMAKLETGAKIYYERMLGEVIGMINEFPKRLPLEDQAKFVIGYFHQRQDLYTSKKDRAQGATA